jgi:glycopeptide antibiotics resistance protein
MKKLLIPISFLIAYSAILIKVMVFKDVPGIRIGQVMLNFGGTHEGPANLIPFKTILLYLMGEGGLIIGGLNIGGNIILLIPIGFLIPFVWQQMNWKKIVILSIAAGLSIEITQVFLKVGIFDIDDVILNAIGVIIGYWVYTISPTILRWIKGNKIVFIIILSIISVLVFYTVSVFQKSLPPLRFRSGALNTQPNQFNSEGNSNEQSSDPCNGTGGTGQIVNVGKSDITIKRKDGIIQNVKLTNQTNVRNSLGSIASTELKIGNRVTLIIDKSETASLVLVCNESNTEPRK